MIECAWFALCDRPAVGYCRGPIGGGLFGPIPICRRCADRFDLNPQPLTTTEGTTHE